MLAKIGVAPLSFRAEVGENGGIDFV